MGAFRIHGVKYGGVMFSKFREYVYAATHVRQLNKLWWVIEEQSGF